MKTVLSVLLAAYLFVGSLFPGNTFANFTELPNLFKHFVYHHKIETPGISFTEFLMLHYIDENHSKSDSENHSKLPLHHHANTAPVDEIVSQCRTGNWLNLNVEISSDFMVQNAPLHSFAVFHGIFRPPQA